MVAIQAVLAIAMAMVVTAAPAGQINANIRFFRIDDSGCNGETYIGQASIFNQPLTSGQLGVDTCIPHSAWGSIKIDQIGTGYKLREFSDANCTQAGPVGTAVGQCVQGLGLDAFYMISST